MIRRSCKGWSY